MLELVLILFSLTVLVMASYTDIKTREVPDTLSYIFILGALGIRLIFSFYSSFNIFLYGLLGFAAMFLFGVIMYYTKQWGGADSKIFMGLGAAFADFFIGSIPFLAILLLAVFFIGAFYVLIWSLTLYFKDFKKMNPLVKKFLKKYRPIRIITLVLGILSLAGLFAVQEPITQISIFIIALTLVFLPYLLVFIKAVEEHAFIKKVPLANVTEGDWLAEDVVRKGKTILSAKHPGLTWKHIQYLKQERIRKVTIKVGIPFLPAILLGVLVTIGIYLFI